MLKLLMLRHTTLSRMIIELPVQSRRGISLSTFKMRKIYTKTGDQGTSAMFSGERRRKDDDVFEALGTLDELSAQIGFAADLFAETHQPHPERNTIGDSKVLLDRLEKIQCCLQDVCSNVATTPSSEAKERQIASVKFDDTLVGDLEKWIDEYTDRLPPLRNFILAGGGRCSSALHVSRAVCRRAERSLVPLLEYNVDEGVYRYVNRLSDFLFTVARSTAYDAGKPERIYRKPKSQSQAADS